MLRTLPMFRQGMKLVLVILSLPSIATASQPLQSESAVKLPVFEVASIRPSHSPTDQFRLMFTADGVLITNASMLMIVRAAYGMFNSLDDKFIGVPAWAKSERFNIEAKVDASDVAAFKNLDFEHRQLMVQVLLTDRFRLQTHAEAREQAIYTLSIAKGGSKLSPARPEATDKDISVTRSSGKIVGTDAVLPQLVSALTQALGRTVQDRTGLPGKYDFSLRWTPEEETAGPLSGATGSEIGPSIFTAIQEQLGLRLDSARGPVQCLVLDHVERPSEN